MRIASVSRRLLILWVFVTFLIAAPGCDGSDGVPPWMGSPVSAAPPKRDAHRWTGVITLDEYDWLGTQPHLGVIQIDLATGAKRRVLDGRRPWRHPRGSTVFLQGCGRNASRVAVADRNGLIRVASPCSNEFPALHGSTPNFDFSRLSPDERRVAVEMFYYIGGGTTYSTVVFDVATRRQLARFDGTWAPTWTPSGRLLLTGEGFHLADDSLSKLERIDRGQLNGPVNNPDVHPSGKRIAFEYNQQIWEMNLDGSGLRRRVEGDIQLRFPAYSPDGKTLVFLGTRSSNFYDRAMFFTDLGTNETTRMDLSKVLGPHSSVVPMGPLSWRTGG